MTKARFLVLGCCLIGLAAGQAEAGVITFDEIGSYSITHFESGGFVFKDTAADAHIAKFPGCTPTCPSNGTNILINPHGSPAEGETSAAAR
jgi:hypothetical protein